MPLLPITLREAEKATSVEDLKRAYRYEVENIYLYLRKALAGETITSPVISVSSGGSSGGGGISTGESAVGYQAVTVGSNTINLPGTGLSSADYNVVAYVDYGSGNVAHLNKPDSQTATTFTYGDIQFAGTLYFVAIVRT